MTFYKNRIYPFLVNKFGNPSPIKEIRKKIIPLAYGNVLEIGVGTEMQIFLITIRQKLINYMLLSLIKE